MNKELQQKIKNIIEELNYRTDQKSAQELRNLSSELYELAVQLVFLESNPKPEVSKKETPKAEPSMTAEVHVQNDLFASIDSLAKKEVEKPESRSQEKPIVEKTETIITKEPKAVKMGKTLNDSLNKSISVGFNDRFAFIHKLFDGNEDDFYRVFSQLNSMSNFEEAVGFLDSVVKPDYQWADKEEYENRLKEILQHHFA